ALRRNALVTFAAVSTAFISLFLLGGSMLVRKQVDVMAGAWGNKVEVAVYLRDDSSRQEIDALNRKISEMPEVNAVYFESKREAFQNFRQQFADSEDLVQNVSPDAIPASYRVKLVNPEEFEVISARLQGDPAVLDVRDEREVLERVFAVTEVLRVGVMAVAIVMLLSAAGLIGNTVRMAVFARRKEIAIMKLVGATNWFIRVPFLIEGMAQGLFGGLLAILALFAMKFLFLDKLREDILFIPWVGTNAIMSTVPILLGAGVVIAAVASLFAMRRFLEV
ncbi:MAG TPA: permease-like cell division protein FtsX, partial [Actinomycetota bacterium]|nr:permease-like cell division protein FtsX [Actinomycetota bacterium]